MPDLNRFLWLFLSLSGRASRAAYFLGGLFISVVQALPLYHFMMSPQGSPDRATWEWIFSVAIILTFWPTLALAVKRLHDLGRPGALALVQFIPLLSILAFLALCLIPGNAAPNRYGQRTNEPE